MTEETLSLLANAATIEPAKKGGTYATWRTSGFGFTDTAKIEAQLRQAGAVWVSIGTKDGPWGTKVAATAIFREPIEEVRSALRERAERITVKPYRDERYSIRYGDRFLVDRATPFFTYLEWEGGGQRLDRTASSCMFMPLAGWLSLLRKSVYFVKKEDVLAAVEAEIEARKAAAAP